MRQKTSKGANKSSPRSDMSPEQLQHAEDPLADRIDNFALSDVVQGSPKMERT